MRKLLYADMVKLLNLAAERANLDATICLARAADTPIPPNHSIYDNRKRVELQIAHLLESSSM